MSRINPTLRRRAREQADADHDALMRLVAIRKSKEVSGLTQAEVARRMGTDPAVISRFESGSVDPRRQTVRQYANAIGARIAYEITDLDRPVPTIPVDALAQWPRWESRKRGPLSETTA